MARTLVRALTLALLLFSTLAPLVLAHAALESASPGPGDKIAGSPGELVLRFSQNLDPSRTSVVVREASGRVVAEGGELGDGPREYRLALPALAPGEYEVRWTSFSAEDGELARDSYTFTIVEARSLTPTPSSSPSPSPSRGPSSSPSPSPTSSAPPASAVPSPGTPAPGSDTSGTAGDAVVVPIAAALLVLAGIGLWLVRRRAT